jgi:hypothetical protein
LKACQNETPERHSNVITPLVDDGAYAFRAARTTALKTTVFDLTHIRMVQTARTVITVTTERFGIVLSSIDPVRHRGPASGIVIVSGQ